MRAVTPEAEAEARVGGAGVQPRVSGPQRRPRLSLCPPGPPPPSLPLPPGLHLLLPPFPLSRSFRQPSPLTCAHPCATRCVCVCVWAGGGSGDAEAHGARAPHRLGPSPTLSSSSSRILLLSFHPLSDCACAGAGSWRRSKG
eukprot:1293976-Rhodomonas_salina.1